MRKLLSLVAIIAFTYVAVSCGGGEGGKVVISVEGGVVTSDDGKLTLDIPAGALDEEVEITITAVSVDELPEELREASGPGPAYLLEPDGLMFNEPVPITITLDRSELDDVPEDGVVAHMLLTLDADGEIESLDEVVTEATLGEETIAVRGELSHFSWLTEDDGFFSVSLERVKLSQEIDKPFNAVVLFENFEDQLTLSPDFVDDFGLPAVEATPGTLRAEILLPETTAFVQARYVCNDPGEGYYGINTRWSVPGTTFGGPYSVTINAKVECVADTPTPDVLATVAEALFATPTPGPATSTPAAATSTPVAPPPTNTLAPSPTREPMTTPMPATTTFTDPTGDEIVMGFMGIVDGGTDAAVDIRTVRIGPSASGTRVFVTFGSAPSQSMTHFTFTVLIALDEQAGLVGVSNGIDVSAAPEGGSFAVGLEGVSMVFAKPVPSGATLVVETIHLETETGDLGVDSFTAIVP